MIRQLRGNERLWRKKIQPRPRIDIFCSKTMAMAQIEHKCLCTAPDHAGITLWTMGLSGGGAFFSPFHYHGGSSAFCLPRHASAVLQLRRGKTVFGGRYVSKMCVASKIRKEKNAGACNRVRFVGDFIETFQRHSATFPSAMAPLFPIKAETIQFQQARRCMFELSLKDIHLGAQAPNKQEAITQVAAALTQAGYASEGYLNGMLQREQQTSTFLGSGIAIPHGTTDTRDLVLNTGVQVFQFPQGIDWGDGQTAYVVIGIAARSNEHLELLRQLTHVLSDEKVADRLAVTTDAEELRSVLTGERQPTPFLFDISLMALDIAAEDMMTLKALNAGRLQQAGAVDAEFVSDVISGRPLNLGQGIWLNDATRGNLASGVAVSRPLAAFLLDGESVALLVTVAMADDQPLNVLNNLGDLVLAGQAERLLTADAAGLLALLTGEAPQRQDSLLSAEFVIRNEHGLHARPGTALVNVIKQFNSAITVANLDGSGKPANGRSLMKVVALGVQNGHRLRFTADGADAEQALKAIGEAIASGLGEGVA